MKQDQLEDWQQKHHIQKQLANGVNPNEEFSEATALRYLSSAGDQQLARKRENSKYASKNSPDVSSIAAPASEDYGNKAVKLIELSPTGRILVALLGRDILIRVIQTAFISGREKHKNPFFHQ